MDVRSGRTHLGLVLLAVMVLAGCGRDAESAGDLESMPFLPAEEAEEVAHEAAPPPAEPAAAEHAAAPSPAQAPAPAPAASTPAPRPTPQPAQQTGSAVVSADPPIPVDDRPERDWTAVPPTAEVRADVRALEAGRTLELILDGELSTESSRAGDVFQARVGEDVLGGGGEVLLPMGTQVRGRVVESRKSEGSDQPALLTLAIESVTVNDAVRPVRASVVEVEMKADARDSNVETAAKVGAGTAAGALVGRILGRDRDAAVRGAVVGTVAGTAAAIATRDGHAVIAPGARLVIQLDERLVVDD